MERQRFLESSYGGIVNTLCLLTRNINFAREPLEFRTEGLFGAEMGLPCVSTLVAYFASAVSSSGGTLAISPSPHRSIQSSKVVVWPLARTRVRP